MQKYIFSISLLFLLVLFQNCSAGFESEFTDSSIADYDDSFSSPSVGNSIIENKLTCDTSNIDMTASFSFMTKSEIKNVIKDLFLLKSLSKELELAIDGIPKLDVSIVTDQTLFNSNNGGLLTSSNYHSKLLSFSEVLVDDLIEDTKIEKNCNDSQNCFDEVVAPLMLRAWRRPVFQEESDNFRTLMSQDSSVEGLKVVLMAIINSPQFYMKSSHTTDSSHEMYNLVHRFSFFMTDSIPDEALFEALTSGEIKSVNDLLPHIDRLMSDSTFVERFVRNTILPWLRLEKSQEDISLISNVILNRKTKVNKLVDAEVKRLVALIKENSNLKEIFHAKNDKSYLLNPLFAFKTSTSRTDIKTHVVNRGFYITENYMCRENPPNQLSAEAIEDALGADHAELGEIEISNIRRSHRSCSGCHSESDKHGIALEQLGPFGGIRTTYSDRSLIDYQLDFQGTQVTSVDEYTEPLSVNAEIHQCFNKIISSKILKLNVFKNQPCAAQFEVNDLELGFKDYIKKIISSPMFMHGI